MSDKERVKAIILEHFVGGSDGWRLAADEAAQKVIEALTPAPGGDEREALVHLLFDQCPEDWDESDIGILADAILDFYARRQPTLHVDMNAEDLSLTRSGAILARSAYQEGVNAATHACNDTDGGKPFRKPHPFDLYPLSTGPAAQPTPRVVRTDKWADGSTQQVFSDGSTGPWTPTPRVACICDGAKLDANQAHPFLVHPECPVHSSPHSVTAEQYARWMAGLLEPDLDWDNPAEYDLLDRAELTKTATRFLRFLTTAGYAIHPLSAQDLSDLDDRAFDETAATSSSPRQVTTVEELAQAFAENEAKTRFGGAEPVVRWEHRDDARVAINLLTPATDTTARLAELRDALNDTLANFWDLEWLTPDQFENFIETVLGQILPDYDAAKGGA